MLRHTEIFPTKYHLIWEHSIVTWSVCSWERERERERKRERERMTLAVSVYLGKKRFLVLFKVLWASKETTASLIYLSNDSQER